MANVTCSGHPMDTCDKSCTTYVAKFYISTSMPEILGHHGDGILRLPVADRYNHSNLQRTVSAKSLWLGPNSKITVTWVALLGAWLSPHHLHYVAKGSASSATHFFRAYSFNLPQMELMERRWSTGHAANLSLSHVIFSYRCLIESAPWV